jgi:hypothetical protein
LSEQPIFSPEREEVEQLVEMTAPLGNDLGSLVLEAPEQDGWVVVDRPSARPNSHGSPLRVREVVESVVAHPRDPVPQLDELSFEQRVALEQAHRARDRLAAGDGSVLVEVRAQN